MAELIVVRRGVYALRPIGNFTKSAGGVGIISATMEIPIMRLHDISPTTCYYSDICERSIQT
ncbi:hypothetical protein N7454_004898 [Penicillium verhagenii]|nr:hypothetical protein N7454_004898 [Penicillium verhagenii]